mgnify:CR=1 FL=1|tara:strand:+ start:31 stop:288 length:258 start_codon:yes stop_codon:yes gene_type:complete
MKRLLLSLLFIPFFTSSSWADPVDSIEIRIDDTNSVDKDANDDVSVITNQVKKQTVEQGQKRPSGWRQKPTSIKRNPGGLKRRAR